MTDCVLKSVQWSCYDECYRMQGFDKELQLALYMFNRQYKKNTLYFQIPCIDYVRWYYGPWRGQTETSWWQDSWFLFLNVKKINARQLDNILCFTCFHAVAAEIKKCSECLRYWSHLATKLQHKLINCILETASIVLNILFKRTYQLVRLVLIKVVKYKLF